MDTIPIWAGIGDSIQAGSPSGLFPFMEILLIILLIAASGLFSGLTIGLMGFSADELQRLSDLGDLNATRILPLVKKSNLLLTTLLLGNTAVNSTLSIFLGSVVGAGVTAGVIATALILVFGEIMPGAILTRHALAVGGRVAWLVRILIILFYPIAAPIAYILDRLLGEALPELLTRRELRHIIETHHRSDESDIDALDRDLIVGALSLESTTAEQIMTPVEAVFGVGFKETLTRERIRELNASGYTRFPVFWDDRVVGVLNIKKLLDLGPEEHQVSDFYKEHKIIQVRSDVKADDLLYRMIRGKVHMAAVSDQSGWIGIVTMEDVLEVIVGQEITDEYGH